MRIEILQLRSQRKEKRQCNCGIESIKKEIDDLHQQIKAADSIIESCKNSSEAKKKENLNLNKDAEDLKQTFEALRNEANSANQINENAPIIEKDPNSKNKEVGLNGNQHPSNNNWDL